MERPWSSKKSFQFLMFPVWVRFIKQSSKGNVPLHYLLLLVGANLKLALVRGGWCLRVIDEPNWKEFELYKPALLGTIVQEKKRLFFTFHCFLLLSFTFAFLPHPSAWTSPRFSGLLLSIKREKVEKAEGLRGAAGGGTCRKSCQLLWVAMIFCFVYDED